MTNVVKVDGKKIDEIIIQHGLSRMEASRRMNAGDSYLSSVIQSGIMAPAYLKLFCLEFGVNETDLTITPSRIISGSRNFVPIDSAKCRNLVYKNGYKLIDVCEKLGYENSWLSNTLARGTMHINTLKRFAELMGVHWKSLLKVDDEENIEEISEESILNTHDVDYIKCVYNLATAIEAALTGFRQDLLAIKGVSDGHV